MDIQGQSDQPSEFAAVAIHENQFIPWPRIAAVAAMVSFSIPTFVTGLEVFHSMSPVPAILSLVVGSLIICVIGGLLGAIGAKTHMSSYLLVRIAFGDIGAGIVNIAFAVSLLGWFGININLFADAADRLARDVFQFDLPYLFWIVVASICMTLTALYGLRLMNALSTAMVPVLAIVTCLMLFNILQHNDLSSRLAAHGGGDLTFGDGVSTVVGGIIVGAIIMPDMTRFARHWSGGVYTSIIAFGVLQMFVLCVSALAGGASNKSDILDVMLFLNLGVGAFIIVTASSWVLNALNLYSAVLSVKATFPKLSDTILTIGLGLTGIAAGTMDLLDHFVTFLFYLSIIFVPVAGVLLVDFLFIDRNRYRIDTLDKNIVLNWKAFLSWSIGAIAAILMSNGLLPSMTKIAALDAVALSALLYFPLAWPDRPRQQHTETSGSTE